MSVKFIDKDHSYSSIDEKENIKWTSVTTLIHMFKKPFDSKAMAEKCSKGKNPKYNKLTPKEILDLWKQENKRAVNLGSWYHDQRERDLLACNTITRNGNELTIINPLMDGDVKLAPDQNLTDGIYPEHFVYLKSASVCGQGDRVEVYDGKINLYDYKTNKEIKTEGFKGPGGKTEKMLPPLSHLDACNYNDYALQLSVYMYIMLKHNRSLKPGVIQMDHVKFEIEKYDKNGYPVVSNDAAGDPMVKEVKSYQLPYLKKEVIAMFKVLNNV